MSLAELATFAVLRTDTSIEGVRFVKGRTAAGDGAAGIFEWVDNAVGTSGKYPEIPENLDDGVAIKPNNYAGSGRWIRQVKIGGPVHAEWFGAKGDGTTNDAPAIQACLNNFGRVDLLRKTYRITTPLSLGPGDQIAGLGMDESVLQLFDQSTPTKLWAIVSAGETPYAAVRDLTIDCGFNDASGAVSNGTRGAVLIRGPHTLIERVKFVNYGVGTGNNPTQECFVVYVTTAAPPAPPDPAPPDAPIGNVQECVFTQPGTHATAASVAEISLIAIGGDVKEDLIGNKNYAVALGGLVRRNLFLDIGFWLDANAGGRYQPSPIHLITPSICTGTEISDNTAVNCDGAGIYIMSWPDNDVIVRGNRLLGIDIGVLVGAPAGEIPSLNPNHQRTEILENFIQIGRNQTPSSHLTLNGIRIQSDVTDSSAASRLINLQIKRNVIHGAPVTIGSTTFYPRGIYFWTQAPEIYEGLCLEDNVIDVKEPALPAPSGWVSTDYEDCVAYTSGYYYRDSNPKVMSRVTLHANRQVIGPDATVKMPITGASYWGLASNRAAAFKQTRMDGRAGLAYDEFLGTLPRSALGWVKVTPSGTSLSAANGEADHPGIAKLAVTGNTAGLKAEYKYGDKLLRLDGGLAQVFEFGVKRSHWFEAADADREYEVWIGLFKSGSTSEEGIYFTVKYQEMTAQNKPNLYNAVLVKAKSGVTTAQPSPNPNYFFNDEPFSPQGGGDPYLLWRRFRLEVLPNVATGSSLQVRFVYEGVPLFTANNTSGSTPIPTTDLYAGMWIKKVDSLDGEVRFLLLDYFQHQVI